MSAMHRKEDKTWTNIHGKTGGGMWERGEPFLKNAYAVAQSGRYQASGAPGWNDGKGLVFVRELTPVKNRARGVVQAPDCVTLNPQISAGYRFGASLDLKWPLLAVGSPGHSNQAGAAYLFLYQAGVWTPLGARMHEKAATRLEFPASQTVPETEAEGSATGAHEVLKLSREIIITKTTKIIITATTTIIGARNGRVRRLRTESDPRRALEVPGVRGVRPLRRLPPQVPCHRAVSHTGARVQPHEASAPAPHGR
jgi:hypothetical protein